MKFVDLYDRVKNNQRMAMQDTRVTAKMTKKEKEIFISRKKA